MAEKKIIIVGGATSTGKTDLGKKLAKRYNGVVVSADSRQVYKGLDLGTGKDKTFYQEMIDIILPGEDYSVSNYSKQAVKIIDEIIKKKKLPVIVGGSGYYIDAIIYKYDFPNVSDKKLTKELEKLSTAELEEKLAVIDRDSVERAQKNRRKLIRALEIVLTTNKPVPKISKEKRFNELLLVLDVEQDILNKRIEKRLDERLNCGLIKEVRALQKTVGTKWLENLGLEYYYTTQYINKKLSYTQMRRDLLSAIVKYSKRQKTWFKRYDDAHWVDNVKKAFELSKNFIINNK